nr:AntigenB like protein [Hymenolepis microstoma]
MRTFCLIALTVLAFVAVTQAQEDNADFKRRVLMKFAEMKQFFTEDPAGKKLREIAMDVGVFTKMLRLKIRGALKAYVQNLLKDGQ